MESNEYINFNGYGKLNWGDSIETFQLVYPNAIEVNLVNVGNSKKLHKYKRFFIEKNNDSIFYINKITKCFEFFENELLKVIVDYGKVQLGYEYALVYKLITQYGKFDWLTDKINKKFLRSTGFNMVNENLRIILTMDYGWEDEDTFTKYVYCSYENRNADKKFDPYCLEKLEKMSILRFINIEL